MELSILTATTRRALAFGLISRPVSGESNGGGVGVGDGEGVGVGGGVVGVGAGEAVAASAGGGRVGRGAATVGSGAAVDAGGGVGGDGATVAAGVTVDAALAAVSDVGAGGVDTGGAAGVGVAVGDADSPQAATRRAVPAYRRSARRRREMRAGLRMRDTRLSGRRMDMATGCGGGGGGATTVRQGARFPDVRTRRRRLRRLNLICCRLGSGLLGLAEGAAAGGGHASGAFGDGQSAQVVVEDLDAAGALVSRGCEGGQDG